MQMERPAMFDLAIRGGSVVTPWGVVAADIGVAGGRIAALGRADGPAAEVFDARGLHVLPGAIDSQVHFREPGLAHKEDLATGSAAAILGGVTTVFEMPNTVPATTSAAALAEKMARASDRMHVDYAFYAGATASNADVLPALEQLPGCAGIKVFLGSSTGDLLVDGEADLARILGVVRRRAAFHSEDEARLRVRRGERRADDPSSHPVWRDAETARLSTERLLRLARAAGAKVHVLHISTAEELPLLAAHRDIATVEVTPHHLTLTDADYARLGTRLQMNPPVRDAATRDALWAAIASGLVDVLGSDHAPHTVAEKARAYPDAPSGMTGVQTLLPLMLDHVAGGRLSLARLADLIAHGPQRVFGIAGKGRIALGWDADFAIVDLARRATITDAAQASRAGWTPYDGRTVTGWPVTTVLRGRPVMRDGEITSSATGQPARFLATLPPQPPA